MTSDSAQPSNVHLRDLAGEKRIEVYEYETGSMRTHQMEDLKNSTDDSSTILKVPVQKWKMHADIIVPARKDSGEAPVQIASVPIPLSMAVKRSVFGQDKSIYATTRV
ncbi:hypothetical protein GQX73_g3752 [Xylaria multiplex]|uniref:Uncharacterized protein n=1 Tax=Xylaria multiplex TaxID=323545 RepID=A0A7C8J353_9PEZI|nr:hypothetical protein GQX73_g3752 [Xylaria multiplex]